MRKEIANWWNQAQRDLLTAKNCCKSGDYYASVFFCHQAVEKGLKFYFMLCKKKTSIPTHSLIFMAQETKIPEKFKSFLRKLTPEYITTRYPNAVHDTPYSLYDQNIAEEFLSGSEEILEWIENQISKP
jgi:HEPN domain-containing protein